MSNGSLDWLGAEQNLSILAGSTRLHLMEFRDTGSGEAMDLSGVTFDGVVTAGDGTETGIEVVQDELNVGRIKVTFPELEVGVYRYEIRAVDDSGEKRRVIYGQLGVLGTSLELGSEVAEGAEELKLLVKVPGRDARRLMLEWQASTWAEVLMEQTREFRDATQALLAEAVEQAEAAKKAAEEAKDIAENFQEKLEAETEKLKEEIVDEMERVKGEITDEANRAEDAAQRAEAAAEGAVEETRERVDELIEAVEETKRQADATVEKLEVFMYKFENKVQSVVWVDPETEHLFIGGIDTGAKVTGEPGKSPYVNEDGDWVYFDDTTREWVNGGPARGEDGFSPYLDAAGFLVYRDPETGEIRVSAESLHGRDGIDGQSVVRHVVDGVEDIPNEGGTCNGGNYYYVENKDTLPRAVIEVLEEGRTAGDTMSIDGVEVELPGAELPAWKAAWKLWQEIKEKCPYLTKTGVSGRKIRLWSDNITVTVNRKGVGYGVIEIPKNGEEGYRVFAWLEDEEGNGQWIQVGMANDLATKEIYGLVKLGTDMKVEWGAPVGTNAEGEMTVPEAGLLQDGVVMVSEGEQVTDGGKVGRNARGQLMATMATRDFAGAVRPSYRGVGTLTDTIGIKEEGRIGIPWATLGSPGVIKLGSEIDEKAPRPYIVGIGATTTENALANNLLVRGALQHQKWSAWQYKYLGTWPTDTMMKDDLYYMGLFTSEQFAQSEQEGLQLLSATGTMLGGVYVATSISDERENAAASATLVKGWLEAEYWNKGDMEVGSEGEWFVAMSNWLHSEFYTQGQIDNDVWSKWVAWTHENFYTKDEIDHKPIWDRVVQYVEGYTYSKPESDVILEGVVNALKKENAETYWVEKSGKSWVAGQLAPYELTSKLLARGYDTVKHVNELDAENIKVTKGIRRIYVMSPAEFESSKGKRDPLALYIKATL